MRTVPAHPHSFSQSEWPFKESTNCAAFTTTRVADDNLPVLVVSRDDDGEWQFLCGTTLDPAHCLVVCLGCAYERDLTLAEVADLPFGWQAQRERIGGPWERYPPEPEPEG